MMDELPAIIHRLSLQLWCPDQVPKEDEEVKEDSEPAVDPLATPPLDAVDAKGHLLDPAEISSLSLDGGAEVHSCSLKRTFSGLLLFPSRIRPWLLSRRISQMSWYEPGLVRLISLMRPIRRP